MKKLYLWYFVLFMQVFLNRGYYHFSFFSLTILNKRSSQKTNLMKILGLVYIVLTYLIWCRVPFLIHFKPNGWTKVLIIAQYIKQWLKFFFLVQFIQFTIRTWFCIRSQSLREWLVTSVMSNPLRSYGV